MESLLLLKKQELDTKIKENKVSESIVVRQGKDIKSIGKTDNTNQVKM
jgi:hypothetical protein